ncbi:restriction endonuclease subunit S [Streptomyces sp. NBC_00102]|uniref:restriction endonuclease subunit S n=1 Tax=Streptomyces sp. NBC_00102 TaxID=2975652 RepID=UPI00225C2F8B|nr:restriction endonuclease subunit S [Streptomyces sp. NBC_00102]MCX5400823.1 restriction endonuclease subunit S [Streptomyces sp. NBC_00102]
MTAWTKTRLKNLCVDAGQYGVGVSSDNYTSSGTRLLRTSDISTGSLSPAEHGVFVATPPAERFLLEAGDLLLSRSGTPPGQSYLVKESDRGTTFAGYLVRFRPAKNVDPTFLSYIARSAPFQHTIQSESVASTIQNFNAERYANIEFEIPSHAEQRRISAFLVAETGRIDRLVSRRESQMRLLGEQAVSDLSSVHRALSERYGAMNLRYMLMRIEQGWSPQCEDRAAEGHEWGVVKAGCVNTGTFDPLQHKALPVGVEPRREYILRPGDLLMSRASGSRELIGSVGIVGELNRNLLLCDKVYRLKLDRTLGCPEFVTHMLRSHQVREHIKSGISGADGMANNLPTATVKGCVIPKVPVSEQRSVASSLDRSAARTARARRLLSQSVDRLAERRQALITAAVTGQFDVSTASGRNVTDGVNP